MHFGTLSSSLQRLKNADPAKVTRGAYVAEAAFEYFISITVSGAFLTLLVKKMGVSDSLTGIISTLVYLACSMQIFAATFVCRWRSIKVSVLFMQTVQQLLYGFLFMLPFLPMNATLRVVLFVALFLCAHFSSNLVSPAKFNWLMSFVPSNKRGVFTSFNEMTSLLLGMTYTFIMSRIVDHYDALGRSEVGLRLCGIMIFVWMFFHIAALLLAKDSPQVLQEIRKTPSLKASIKANFSNKAYLKILVAVICWNFFANISTPYFPVYLLQELNSTITFIALAGVMGNLFRFAISLPMGRYGDKHGFDRSVRLGFILAAASFFILIFWRPGNGQVLYLLFQLPYAGTMATLCGGLINILFQYVPAKDRVGAMGLYSALGGISAFAGSLAGGAILDKIQGAGNTVLGLPMYAQQFLSLISFVGLCVLVVYQKLVVERMTRLE